MNQENNEFIKRNLYDLGRKVKRRYEFLLLLAEYLNPKRVVEIGTWNGDRSEGLVSCLPNLELFVGFDLFESSSEEIRVKEKTMGCMPACKNNVYQRLTNSKANPECNIELIEGDTHETLPQFTNGEYSKSFDFIFLDECVQGSVSQVVGPRNPL